MSLAPPLQPASAPHVATSGFASTCFANTYAPFLAIDVTGSGNDKQDAALASLIANQVDRSIGQHKPNTFRHSRAQALTKQAADMRGASSRNK